MTSVGETLRAERLKRNLALDEISNELKISSRLLNAIEAGDFSKLPGGVFTRSFVRQYARLLGLDDEELASQVQRVIEPQNEIAQSADKLRPMASGLHVPKMEQWESVSESRFRWSGSLSAAAIFVVALLICSGVYTWMQRPRTVEIAQTSTATSAPPVAQQAAPVTPSPTASESPAATGPAGPSPALTPATDTAATGTPAAPSSAAPASAPPASAAPASAPLAGSAIPTSTPIARTAPADPNANVRVEIAADEPVWILARADGKYAFSGTLDAHQSRMVEAVDTIVLRLGNAGAANITWNGKPVGPVGPKGQPRTIQFTSGGFQIVPAKPPAALEPR